MAGATVMGAEFPVVRIPEAKRKFKSLAVEKTVREVRQNIGNKVPARHSASGSRIRSASLPRLRVLRIRRHRRRGFARKGG